MAAAKKRPSVPPQNGGKHALKRSDLLVLRLKELDREFARQTKQLRQLTEELAKKIVRKDK